MNKNCKLKIFLRTGSLLKLKINLQLFRGNWEKIERKLEKVEKKPKSAAEEFKERFNKHYKERLCPGPLTPFSGGYGVLGSLPKLDNGPKEDIPKDYE